MKQWNNGSGSDADHRQNNNSVHGPAVHKAMNLLLHRDRTEQELRNRLEAGGFSAEETEEAIQYAASFGYVNDRRYAENYAISFTGKKSRRMIAADLRARGVDERWIEEAVSSLPQDETEQIRALIRKRAGEPHVLEQGEKRRLQGYLARRGFGSSDIIREISHYENLVAE